MIHALVLWPLLSLTAAPEATLGPWVPGKLGSTRELRFSDKAGAHVVRFELSPEQTVRRGELQERSQHLLVVHRVGKQERWRAKDLVEACAFDLTLEVLEGSIEVTDLDDDGEPEVSFAYRLGCRSDVSPRTVKLLLYAGSSKYALRGESREQLGETEFAGGDFTVDPAFQKAPPRFLAFAKAKWQALVVGAK